MALTVTRNRKGHGGGHAVTTPSRVSQRDAWAVGHTTDNEPKWIQKNCMTTTTSHSGNIGPNGGRSGTDPSTRHHGPEPPWLGGHLLRRRADVAIWWREAARIVEYGREGKTQQNPRSAGAERGF